MKPEVVIGWVLAADLRDGALLAAYAEAREHLRQLLVRSFPEFDWKVDYGERRIHLPRGALDPVALLEIGVDEKLHRRWDYALVVVPNELLSRHRPYALGVPSSALEVAVLSSSRLGSGEPLVDRLLALSLHLLGHLWGLGHAEAGPMRPIDDPEGLEVAPFFPEEAAAVRRHLEEVVVARLEEERVRWNAFSFYARTFFDDPHGIIRTIREYAPWKMPIYLGRLTAAAAVSTVYLVMTSDAWALGTRLPGLGLGMFALIGFFGAAFFLFYGQDLGRLGHERTWREQLARTRLVLFGTVLAGMASLWALVFSLTLSAGLLIPRSLLEGWIGSPLGWGQLLRFATFSAAISVLAAAMGGNLEEEAEIKAEFFMDEEV